VVILVLMLAGRQFYQFMFLMSVEFQVTSGMFVPAIVVINAALCYMRCLGLYTLVKPVIIIRRLVQVTLINISVLRPKCRATI